MIGERRTMGGGRSKEGRALAFECDAAAIATAFYRFVVSVHCIL